MDHENWFALGLCLKAICHSSWSRNSHDVIATTMHSMPAPCDAINKNGPVWKLKLKLGEQLCQKATKEWKSSVMILSSLVVPILNPTCTQGCMRWKSEAVASSCNHSVTIDFVQQWVLKKLFKGWIMSDHNPNVCECKWKHIRVLIEFWYVACTSCSQ